ncbi:hypothetical protein P2318_13895 [Myxococcaceae bacterium GXIMD 01537]
MNLRLCLAATAAAAAVGCATTPPAPRPNFNAIYPGMTSQQVVQSMLGGPSHTQEYPDGSTAWYYGENRCVLVREDKVVSKDRTEEDTSLAIPGVGGLRTTNKAFCAPAGVAAPKSTKDIDTPFGTIRNADGIVNEVKGNKGATSSGGTR